MKASRLRALLGPEPGAGVGHLDVQLGGPLDDLPPLLGGDVVGDLGGVLAVVHQEELEVVHVVDAETVEAVGQHVPGLLVRSVTDLGHDEGTLELPPHPVVNTAGLPP